MLIWRLRIIFQKESKKRNVSKRPFRCRSTKGLLGIELASHHSCAVDYPKTGVPAKVPHYLRPKMWPHFMEKRHKPKDQIYVSKKVLGQLYDLVERVDFVPDFEAPFDPRILNAYNLDSQILLEASEIKAIYDAAMHRIMAQHEIRTEHEVWSTFVLQHANQSKDFKFHEEMGAISSSLKDRFRTACYDKAGGTEFAKIGPFVAAMYRVTNDELTSALAEYYQFKTVGGKEVKGKQKIARNMPLISFPWLFPGILGKIANRDLTASQGTTDEFVSNIPEQPRKPGPKPKSGEPLLSGEEDILRTTKGLVHRGELLRLFVDAERYHGTPGQLAAEVAASSSSRPVSSIEIDEAEYSTNVKLRTYKVEPSSLESTPHLNKGDDTESRLDSFMRNCEGSKEVKQGLSTAHSPRVGTLIDFDVDEKIGKNTKSPSEVQLGFNNNTGSTCIPSSMYVEFDSDDRERDSDSLYAIRSSHDLVELPAVDLLDFEDGSDQVVDSPHYTPSYSSDTQIEIPLVEGDSKEGAPALDRESNIAQHENPVIEYDHDLCDRISLAKDGGETSTFAGSHRIHDTNGVKATDNVDSIQELEYEGMLEEEEVVLDLDGKPSLLERLALLNAK